MTAGIPTVRRLTSDDALPLARLRLQALEREPASFESAPGDDRLEQPGYIASILADPRHGVFGALGDRLVGFVGAAPSSHAKAAHCYELWGLYVEPPFRGRGVARALVTAAIGFARSAEGVTCLRLTVTDAAPQAEALYRSLGFVTWGREPDVLRVDGTPIAERGMRLEFARPSAGDDPSGATADV